MARLNGGSTSLATLIAVIWRKLTHARVQT
jgi:hypothetical protein